MRKLEQFEKTYIAKAIESKLQVQDVEISNRKEDIVRDQPYTVSVSFAPVRDKNMTTTITVSIPRRDGDTVGFLIVKTMSAISDYLKEIYVYKHRGGK